MLNYFTNWFHLDLVQPEMRIRPLEKCLRITSKLKECQEFLPQSTFFLSTVFFLENYPLASWLLLFKVSQGHWCFFLLAKLYFGHYVPRLIFSHLVVDTFKSFPMTFSISTSASPPFLFPAHKAALESVCIWTKLALSSSKHLWSPPPWTFAMSKSSGNPFRESLQVFSFYSSASFISLSCGAGVFFFPAFSELLTTIFQLTLFQEHAV